MSLWNWVATMTRNSTTSVGKLFLSLLILTIRDFFPMFEISSVSVCDPCLLSYQWAIGEESGSVFFSSLPFPSPVKIPKPSLFQTEDVQMSFRFLIWLILQCLSLSRILHWIHSRMSVFLVYIHSSIQLCELFHYISLILASSWPSNCTYKFLLFFIHTADISV